MNKDDENDIIEIFAGSSVESGIVQSILTDYGIEAILRDEHMGMIAPWQAAPGGAGAVKVLISSRDQDKARAIIDEYNKNINETDND